MYFGTEEEDASMGYHPGTEEGDTFNNKLKEEIKKGAQECHIYMDFSRLFNVVNKNKNINK